MSTGLLHDVAHCEYLLADHLAAAVQRFGAGALDVIDLPPLDEVGRASPAQLRVAATLLWARHVDESGLLDFVDALARGVFDGTLHLPIAGAAVDPLVTWWRSRDERFERDERQAIHERLFGRPSDLGHPVARLLASLCQALIEVGRAGATGEERQARIHLTTVARELAAALSERAVGISGFAARELVAQVRQALALLSEPEVDHVLGGLGPWQSIRMWSHLLLGRRIDPAQPIRRARAGLQLIEWLADNAPVLDGDGTLSPGDAVIAAAATYASKGTT